MKIHLLVPSFGLLIVPLLTQCGSTSTTAVNGIVPSWTTRQYTVRLNLDSPGGRGGVSKYTITRNGGSGTGDTLVMLSAQSTSGFSTVADGKGVTEFFRIVEERGGNALLIQENIPNDHSPCSNYLWIRPDKKGNLKGTYLRLPTAPLNQIEYENPFIQSLDGGLLEYKYSNGRTVRQPISRIPTEDSPQTPG